MSNGVENMVNGVKRVLHTLEFTQLTPVAHLRFVIITSLEDFDFFVADPTLTIDPNLDAARKVLKDTKPDSIVITAARPLRNEQFAIIVINEWCDLARTCSDLSFAVNYIYTTFATNMTGSAIYNPDVCVMLKDIVNAAMMDYSIQTSALLFRGDKRVGNLRVFGVNIFGHPMREIPGKPNAWEVARWPSEVTKILRENAEDSGPSPHAKLIRQIFLGNGFTIKEGQDDLKPYVYAAADKLISAYDQLLKESVVTRVVRAAREFSEFGILSLEAELCPEKLYSTPINPEVAVALLRASFPWKDVTPGWYKYRDFVVENWPKDDTTMERELAGIRDVPRPPDWHAV